MEDCDLIIMAKYVLPMDGELSVIADGAIAVRKRNHSFGKFMIKNNKVLTIDEENVLKKKPKK